MKIEVHVYHHFEGLTSNSSFMEEMEKSLRHILKQLIINNENTTTMANEIKAIVTDLVDQVSQMSSVIDSSEQVLETISSALDNAIDTDDKQALIDLSTTIKAKKTELAEAIAKATAADPTTPQA